MAKMEHFEIPADDLGRAQTFYRDVLGYEFEPWGEDMGMLTQPDDEGVNGDLHRRAEVPHPTVVFTVDRIEDTIALAVASGGTQASEIQALGESGRWAYITDSEGNTIGLFDEVAVA